MRAIGRRLGQSMLALALTLGLVIGLGPVPAQATTSHSEPRALTLVVTSSEAASDQVLSALGGATPTYRWSTALHGLALPLTQTERNLLTGQAGVIRVEANSFRKLASTKTTGAAARLPNRAGTAQPGGRGVVIGIVDSGLNPRHPLFALVPGLGGLPTGFRGSCDPTWGACNGKVVAADWFISGFGRHRVSSTTALSPADDSGHGTLVASIAAGNKGVTTNPTGPGDQHYSGTASQARLAIYKACWSAPDPADDGCSTADLVTAVDRAVADGVDIINLSVAGTVPGDALDLATLGAAEHDVFVTTAAGNSSQTPSLDSPWVTTVGALSNRVPSGQLSLGTDGPLLTGAMRSPEPVTAPVVLASHSAAPGISVGQARVCAPGSLDAAKTAGKIVVCDRGRVGRVEKSRTVALADGVGMVLADTRRADVHADFHSVPTIHVRAAAATQLITWVREHPRAQATLAPATPRAAAPRVTSWSAPGSLTAHIIKPDLVAPGIDVLGAAASGADNAWALLSGTSAAAARVSGEAARLIAAHPDWSAAMVRSALISTARPVPGSTDLRQGAGRVDAAIANQPGLVLDVPTGAWRTSLTEATELNLPAIKTKIPASGTTTLTRTVTNVGKRDMYYSLRVGGFQEHQVKLNPVAVRLAPGASQVVTIRISGPASRRVDDGRIRWLGANGRSGRIPVVIVN